MNIHEGFQLDELRSDDPVNFRRNQLLCLNGFLEMYPEISMDQLRTFMEENHIPLNTRTMTHLRLKGRECIPTPPGCG